MPIATPAQYRAMLDAAQKGGYAYPAVNVTSITTINGALRAFAEAKSDGIIQVSTGGGQFASGTCVNDAAFGAIVLAEAAHLLAEKYDILVGLHTDHCHPEKVESFLKPLLEASRKRIAAGKGPLFQSHMFDGSVVSLDENLKISKDLLKECAELDIILYHFPKLSGVPITHGLIERLIAAYPAQIGGVKDSTGDADSTAGFLAAFPDLAIFPGTEAFLLDALRGGAAGTITATANVHAGAARRVYDAWCAGSEDADALQVPVTAVRQAIQVQPMVPMLKYLVAKARSDDAWLRVRPPIATLPVADCAAVERTLDDLGFVMGG